MDLSVGTPFWIKNMLNLLHKRIDTSNDKKVNTKMTIKALVSISNLPFIKYIEESENF